MNVFYTKVAERDLDRIWSRIARDSCPNATSVVLELRDRCRLLTSQPEMGERCDRYGKGMRRISVGWYVVYYRIQKTRISIARVLHGARDIERLF